MKSLTRSETAAFLQEQDRFLILTHRKPDGDTLGSAALLCRGLRQLGKTVHILRNPEITPRYQSLVEGMTKEVPEESDMLLCVDVASPGQLPMVFRDYQERISLRIDHHGSATPFTPVSLVDPKAAACAEIIYDVLKEMGAKLDEPMADALYIGVSTDTGCFRYANTTANSYAVAADCAAVSKNLHSITQQIFETNSLPRLRLQGYLVENARFLLEGKAVLCLLPKVVERELGVTEDDLDSIASFPRTIEGVKLSVLIRQDQIDTVKFSVRGVPGWDASALCSRFGGGGHKGAAGASVKMDMEEAAAAVEAAVKELFG